MQAVINVKNTLIKIVTSNVFVAAQYS